MKFATLRLPALGVCVLALVGSDPSAAAEKQPIKDAPAAFGVLRVAAIDTARKQAQEWLQSTGKFDQAAFEAIWKQADRPVIDLVADTLALGNADAQKLLAEARNTELPAPKTVPDIFKDAKQPTYLRANLALAYARALTQRRVYEEALGALKAVRAEHVVDPAGYFFYKAVAEHGMGTLYKDDARRSLARLMDEVPEAPERYKTVGALMYLDMDNWSSKDLDDIARKMGNIGRRLDLARGGPQTQKMQKEVIARLDEKIKELENKSKGGGGGGGGGGKDAPGCPPSGGPGSGQGAGAPNSPQQDSYGGQNNGPGKVTEKRFQEIVENWGRLPPTERTKAMTEMIRGMPPAYQKMIEDFYKRGAGSLQP